MRMTQTEEEAFERRSIEIAKWLIADGVYEDEKIADATGLSLETVMKLRSEIESNK